MADLSLFEEQNKNELNKLTEPYYKETEFKGLDLANGELKGKEFYRCKFTSCNFFKVKFISCEFDNCTFAASDLSLSIVKGSKFLSTYFKDSKSVGIDWREVRRPSTFKFVNSKIDNNVFYKMDLRSINLINCSAQNVDFVEADLSKAVFTNTDLSGSRFSFTNLAYADFSEAFNYNINPKDNKLKKTVFSMPEAVSLLNDFDIIIK